MIAYEPVVSELPETAHRAGTIRRPANALPALLRHLHCARAADVGRARSAAASARAFAAKREPSRLPLRPIPMGSRIPSRRRLSPFRRRTPPNWPLSKRRLRARAPSGVGGGTPAAPRQAFTETQPTFPSTPTPEGYQKKYTIWFSPKYLQYVAPVGLFLVFILTFFPWVGVYPGGVADAWQNAWQAAFGGYSIEPGRQLVVVDRFPDKYADKNGEKSSEPGCNVLLIFYLVLLIPTLVIALGCLALPFLPSHKLPPAAASDIAVALGYRGRVGPDPPFILGPAIGAGF